MTETNLSSPIILEKKDILNYLRMTPPFVFVDHAEVIPGQSGKGYRDFPENEWFFECHFPNDPIVPGAFQLECIMQTGLLCMHALNDPDLDIIYASKFINVDLLNGVRPNDRLFTETEIKSFRRGLAKAEGKAFLIKNDKKILTCKAEFQMVMSAVMAKFMPS